MVTILLTSAGGLAGTYLIKHFRKTAICKTVGIDSNEYVPARGLADIFYKGPKVNETVYLQSIKEIMEKENCDIIIPVSSHDITYYSKNKS